MNFKKNRKKDYEPDPFRKSDRRTFLQFITDNKKLVMPLILIVAVCLTVLIALHANQRIVEETYAGTGADPGETQETIDPKLTALKENTNQDIEDLVMTYFDAYSRGDMDTIKSLYEGLEEADELKLKEVSKYIDSVDSVKIYTKPGLDEGTWIAYIYTEVTFKGYKKAFPGMQTMYICSRNDGSLYINGDVVEGKVADYISEVSLQADVVDLNNSVAAEYNDLITGDEELSKFLGEMSAQIQVSVDEALATMEAGDSSVAEEEESSAGEAGNGEGEDTETPEEDGKVIIKALDVVNIRTSDSETADKISKTQKGQELEEIELLPNGWSKIKYEGREAYVKSEYFELVSGKRKEAAATSRASSATEASSASDTASSGTSAQTAQASSEASSQTAQASASAAASTSTSASSASASSSETVVVGQKTGRMKVMESVKLRSGQGTDSTAYMTLYPGTFVDVTENYANGWSKVKYGERTGYIKSEFLE